jgi:hydrogenase 3 maturation protease
MRRTLWSLARLLANHRAAVVGVGNRLRGDDAVGPLVAERLAAEFPGRVIDAGSVPENFVGPILSAGADVVVFVDAATRGAAPGCCQVVRARELASRGPATHVGTLRPLAQLLEARGLSAWMVGVEPRVMDLGAPMSREVTAAAERVVSVLGAALRTGGDAGGPA